MSETVSLKYYVLLTVIPVNCRTFKEINLKNSHVQVFCAQFWIFVHVLYVRHHSAIVCPSHNLSLIIYTSALIR